MKKIIKKLFAPFKQLYFFTKNNKKKALLTLFAAVMLVAGLAAVKNQIDLYQREIATLKDHLATIRSANDEYLRKNAKLQELKAQKQAKIDQQAKKLKNKNQKIKKLEQEVEALEQEISASIARQNLSFQPQPLQGSIYDRIDMQGTARQRTLEAIKLLETHRPYIFNILNQQISAVNNEKMCPELAGYQSGRQIYIDVDCAFSWFSDATLASLIAHEAMHVQVQYVWRVYERGKAQELPAYKEQLKTAKALNATEDYINWIKKKIEYWESQ